MGYTETNAFWSVTKLKFETESEEDRIPLNEHTELTLRKQLSQGKYLSESKEDKLERLTIPSEDKFDISKFVKSLTGVLKDLGAASLISKTFGWMDEYAEVVGTPDELKTWPSQIYGFLDHILPANSSSVSPSPRGSTSPAHQIGS